jgi:hypothetical protein
MHTRQLKPLLWTRIGFKVDPDPGSQTHADPDPSKIMSSQKV